MFFKRHSPRSAFTLMEMLVVIAILGLLVGIVAVNMQGHLARSRVSAAKIEIAKLGEALDAYSGVHAAYPTTEQGLIELTGPSGQVDDRFIKPGELNDPWGTAYEYLVPGENNEPYELISAGPDRQFETEDDISSLTMRNE
jgi:general secretion pathway protein G